MDWSQPKVEDLGCLLMLDSKVQEFLSEEELSQANREHEDDPDQPGMPEPSLDNSNQWVLWCAYWVETPAWWLELQMVPNQTDIPQFARCMQASFQMPKARCHAEKMDNDYSALPTLHCIERDAFLPLAL